MQLETGQNAFRSSTRDKYWDSVKCLLIFLVVWGHCIQFVQFPYGAGATYFWEIPTYKGIYLFHMPLFMLISGYFAVGSIRKRGLASLRRYASRLIIPSVSYSVIYMGLRWIAHLPQSFSLQQFTLLWFLNVVFESTCIYYFVRQWSGVPGRIMQFVLPVFVVVVFNHYFPDIFPSAGQFSYLWPFFMAGTVLNERGLKGSHISKWFALFILPVIPLSLMVSRQLFVYASPLDLSMEMMVYDLTRTCVAIVIGIGFLGLAQCLRPILQYSIFQKIAQAALALYVLQSFCCVFIKALLPHGVPNLPHFAVFALALLLLLLLYALYSILRKIPLIPFLLFGEKK